MSLHAPAFAFKISPFNADMAPAGPRSRLDYLVENESSDATAVQIGVVRREQSKDGTETLVQADDAAPTTERSAGAKFADTEAPCPAPFPGCPRRARR